MFLESLGKLKNSIAARIRFGAGLEDKVEGGRALVTFEHRNSAGKLLWSEKKWNLVTNAGRDFLHQQGYQTSGLGANGLNFIALSADALTETIASTTLSNEIVANGLSRAQGTVSHTAGTNLTTVSHVFACSVAPQSAQKAALFSASNAGTMNHCLSFAPRSLQVGDTLTVSFQIQLG